MTYVRPVLDKVQNYVLWQGGAYGNRLRAWRMVAAWRAAGAPGPVTLRTLGAGGGPCAYDVPADAVADVVAEWILLRGVALAEIMVNESAPDATVVIQGEYLNDLVTVDGQLYDGALLYSMKKLKMRDALRADGAPVYGWQGRLLLRGAMTPSSWADFETLLERYPGHVLEVSVYSSCLGDVSGRNALVWEVRRY
jgi:hypothetical protein